MRIIITRTDGAGTGEKWDGTHFARPFEKFLEFTNRNVQKVYSDCKSPVPDPLLLRY